MASSQSLLPVTCSAGILSLLVPSTKIIFRTQIFNFFVCFWVCFVFFWSAAGVIQGNLVSWSLRCPFLSFLVVSVTPQNRGKAVRTEIEFFNPSRLFSASQTAATSRKSFVRFRKPFVNFSSYSYLKKDSLKKGS